MSRLYELDNRMVDVDIILLQTDSVKLSMFIEDNIKRRFSDKDAIFDTNTQAEIKEIKELVGVAPPFSDKWFINVNLDKIKKSDIDDLIELSNTCIFFCTCSSYKTYKEFYDRHKEDRLHRMYDFYLKYLTKRDFIYLYDAYVPEAKRLPTSLFNYVYQSYASDIDALYKLLEAINEGKIFKTRTDITDYIGLGGLSVDSILFSMLTPLSGSVKGAERVRKNKLKAMTELGDSIGYTKYYNFLNSSLDRIIQIKVLMINGVVYKQIKDLPNGYEEDKLIRYQKYLPKIETIPLSRLLRMKQLMGKRWRDDLDMIEFIYKYYDNEMKLLLTC